MNVEPIEMGQRGPEAFWRHDDPVTTSPRNLINAERLTLPFQLALLLIGSLIALVVGYYTGQAQWSKEMAGLRSDVRDGFTMLQGDRKADAIRMDVIRRDLDEVMRTQKLHEIQIHEDHDQIVMMKRGVK